jgi:predicted nucleic acid-binding protein
MEITLDNLTEEGNKVLFDTSAISNYLQEYRSGNLVQRTERSIANTQFIETLIQKTEDGCNFYVTRMILNELFARNYNLKKRIKQNDRNRMPGEKSSRAILDFQRQANNEARTQRRLACLLQDSERVLQLNEREKIIYHQLSRSYSWMEERYGLSQPDFDFLISGNALAYDNSGKVILVTNDIRGIVRAGGALMNMERILGSSVVYLARKGPSSFEILNGFHRD